VSSSFTLDPKTIKKFQKEILHWYKKNKRDLPWRRTRDPYHILISEVMLQQTQVNRVIPKYEKWLQVLPTIQDLAKAKVSDVLRLWSGLGYNRRALNLKKTAEIIVKEYGSVFPQEEKELVNLPGIGKYTARALMCFAFDKQVAVVDTNIRKVILTKFFTSHPEPFSHPEQGEGSQGRLREGSQRDSSASPQNDKRIGEKEIQKVADKLLPKGKAYDWNHALMDYATAKLRQEKIPIPKQSIPSSPDKIGVQSGSKFLGSHRYYRGQVLKVLLQKKKSKVSELGILIKKDYSLQESGWLKRLLAELVKEGFVEIRNKEVFLAT